MQRLLLLRVNEGRLIRVIRVLLHGGIAASFLLQVSHRVGVAGQYSRRRSSVMYWLRAESSGCSASTEERGEEAGLKRQGAVREHD